MRQPSSRTSPAPGLAPYAFLLPAVLLWLIFQAYPLVCSLYLSLHHTAPGGARTFVGLQNFGFLLNDPRFWLAVAHTLGFTIAYLVVQIPCALALAVLLNHPNVRWASASRFAFLSTYLVGPVFVGLLFAQLFRRDGFVIGTLASMGVDIDPFNSPVLALPLTLLAALWLSTGLATTYLSASMRRIDPQLYDSATVDGAGGWRRFWHVTLPGVRPVLAFLLLAGAVVSLQLFELPYVLFQGAGPRSSALTIVMYLFIAFFAGDVGYASAVAWTLVALIVVVGLPLWKMARGWRV